MSESKSGIANEKQKGTMAIAEIKGCKITSINVIDVPQYWYHGAWHPYPKDDKISIVEK